MNSPDNLTRDHGQQLLYEMLRIRRFEEKCAELYSAGKIRGFLHLYIGEEAIAVGTIRSLGAEDAIVSTYREHGHALARGLSPGSVLAEMFGRQNGCCRGRGGSMHLFDAGRRFYGGNAIVGGHLPVAVGLALADKMLGRPQVTACFFGDGVVAEGDFHESLNLAALWKLPLLLLCENNQYAMGTAISRHQSQTDIHLKADGYGIPAAQVDGMDVLAVEAAAKQAVDHVRSGAGPYFLEALTYRFRAHSMYDAELYRDKEEVDRWKQRDPIDLFVALLRERGLFSDDDMKDMEKRVASEIVEAVAFADAGLPEPVEDLTKDVCTPITECVTGATA